MLCRATRTLDWAEYLKITKGHDNTHLQETRSKHRAANTRDVHLGGLDRSMLCIGSTSSMADHCSEEADHLGELSHEGSRQFSLWYNVIPTLLQPSCSQGRPGLAVVLPRGTTRRQLTHGLDVAPAEVLHRHAFLLHAWRTPHPGHAQEASKLTSHGRGRRKHVVGTEARSGIAATLGGKSRGSCTRWGLALRLIVQRRTPPRCSILTFVLRHYRDHPLTGNTTPSCAPHT